MMITTVHKSFAAFTCMSLVRVRRTHTHGALTIS
jgi:hypothetical protein